MGRCIVAFTHLHTHSEHSILDGMGRISEMVQRVKDIGQNSLAISDHGNMSCWPDFYKIAHQESINPIIGQEFYITPDATVRDKKKPNWHIVLLARNREGYFTLSELSSIASQNFYYKPRIDWNILKEYSHRFDDIIALTGCMNGEIPWWIAQGKPRYAEKIFKLYRVLFPHLYVEFQKHGGDEEFAEKEKVVAQHLLHLSRKYSVPIVLTGDAHYVNLEDAPYHDMWLTLQTKDTIDNPKRFHFSGHGYHIQTEEEMRRIYPKLWPEFERNTRRLVKGINIEIPEMSFSSWYIPEPQIDMDPFEYVQEACEKGLQKRVPKELHEQYRTILKYQLRVIHEANFEREFVIVEDYVNWARSQGYFVGGGRGSMAGVLPSYLMGIGDIDPVRFKLSFERAINPARPSLPDFDIDFDNEGREAVVEYLKQKYGIDNVVPMGTLLRFGPRSILGKVLKALGFSFQDQIKFTKSLPDSVEIDNNKSTDDIRTLLVSASSDPEFEEMLDAYPEVVDYCIKFSGLIYSMGTHAAGVIISDEGRPIKKLVPTIRIKNEGNMVTQYDMYGMKNLGFVKFDILGLSTLNVIKETIEIIGHNPVENFPDGFDMNDVRVFRTINDGYLQSIFQLEGYANRMAMKQIGGIEDFEDVVSIISIARPGTSQFIPQFAENKKNPNQVKYFDPRLKEILQSTHGVLLLQEQVMAIARDFAGFDNLQLDDIKETIKAKNPERFKQLWPTFRDGCRNYSQLKNKHIRHLWGIIQNAAGYLYNRAHAVSYASITYLTAWLKTYYPKQYYLAMLRHAAFADYPAIIKEARRIGIQILPADIFKSGVQFEEDNDGNIRFGFANVKYLGVKMGDKLVSLRTEKGDSFSVEDIAGLNVGVFKHLNAAGALVPIGGRKPTRTNETAYYGMTLVTDPLRKYRSVFKKYVFNKRNQRRLTNGGQDVVIGGVVERINKITTKNGQPMAFIKLSLDDQFFDMVLFPNMIHMLDDVRENTCVLAFASKQPNHDSFVPESIEELI